MKNILYKTLIHFIIRLYNTQRITVNNMVILDSGHIFQYNLPRTAAKLTRLHNKCVTRLHTGLQEIWDWGWLPLVVGTEATASDFSNRGRLTSKIRRKL